MLDRLNRFRKAVPFWWWLIYDLIIGFLIAALFVDTPHWWRVFLLGAASMALLLSISLDTIEFFVKRRA